ncbi:MAG: Lrp/AsnC family transcriptional regulator [Terrimonas sp.]|uniref:Lrp/AsnC family transcriptional regulator n=1 Tax=Terrimonas sp. TaxID=1914338 RepID=UPI00092655CC|nr:Lrp/AsnC family transcriptional regulator [Terrimonas sp.]MBN8790501.1 Lrp/AsnC family transcriptional regulator [Terrimonas sp.]OJY93610.1 MAG: AsnC family transcriptional regulator [Sphingobacteriales bacterium 40-81]PVD53086.1 AsnC family transcriptional regulator [Terrimonas sp.]
MKKAVQKENLPLPAPVLDDKDMAILRLLQQNARATVREISDTVHLSTTPVHERIKRMEEAGVIKQYATLLDHAKVKKGLMVICYVSLKQHNKTAGAKFIKAIQEMNEVVECYNISGDFDFMLKVMAENMDDYYNFHVNKLSEADNIGNVQSVFVMGVIKQTHQLVY